MKSLNQLLFLLDSEQLNDFELAELRAAIFEKVDGCALYERELSDEVKRLREIAREFTEAARAAERRLERFLDYVKYAMTSKGFEKIPGERFECLLKENPPKVVIDQEPTSFDAEAFPSYVRTKFEWDKSAIKASAESGDIPFARIVREQRAVFGIRKGRQ